MKADQAETEAVRDDSAEPPKREPDPPADAAPLRRPEGASPAAGKVARTDKALLVDPTGAPVKAPPPRQSDREEEAYEEPRSLSHKRRWVWITILVIIALA